MFERFTEKAIKVIMLAQEEARRLGHNFVGTEQILLGLIGEGSGVGPKILKSMGVKLKDARIEVEKIIHMPLDSLLNTMAHDPDPSHNIIQEMFTFEYENKIVWGASARILKQMHDSLKS